MRGITSWMTAAGFLLLIHSARFSTSSLDVPTNKPLDSATDPLPPPPSSSSPNDEGEDEEKLVLESWSDIYKPEADIEFPPTVTIVILVRNKAHALPNFLGT